MRRRPRWNDVSALGGRASAGVTIVGTNGDDVLSPRIAPAGQPRATRLSDTLYGYAGDDQLDGGRGADHMVGGRGDDRYVVDDAGDVVVETANGGVDHVFASVDYRLANRFVERLTLSGRGHLSGTGNGLDNVIAGNDGRNALTGLGGDDTLIGGLGRDVLRGGGGADRYVFDAPITDGRNVDLIVGFQPGEDGIVLDASVFARLSAAGPLQAPDFFAGAAAHDTTDRILYDTVRGLLLYDPDGTGAAAASPFARVAPGAALTVADFHTVGAPSPGPIGVVVADYAFDEVVSGAAPLLFRASLDFEDAAFSIDDAARLTPGAQLILHADGQVSAADVSEAFSFEMLARGAGAVLLQTSDAIAYAQPGAVIDYTAEIAGAAFGVEVTRAFLFPAGTPVSESQALNLLAAKCDDLHEAQANAADGDSWSESLLFAFAIDDQAGNVLAEAWGQLDSSVRGEIALVIARTDGADAPLYFG